jgi:Ca-activated chloride channel homolog
LEKFVGMKRFAFVSLLVFCFALLAAAQSGRRIKSLPEPTPVVNPEDTYSESRSYKPRRIYPPNYKNKDEKPESTDEIIESSNGTEDGDDVIEIDSTLVTIPISVYDRNGIYIPNIKQEEVKIFEDGKEQEIAYFRISEQPVTVALLIDTSPSTEYKIEEIRNAAKAFVGQLQPHDKVLVMEFDGDPQILSEATTDRQKIFKAIDEADFGSGTALYDAVDLALNKRLNRIEGRRAIVLFTDGVDTVSRKSFYSTMTDAEESETIIFPIYYNTFLNGQGINGGVFGTRLPRNTGHGTSAEEYALGKKYLEDLAASTGGRVYQPDRSVGGLTRAFEGIAEELRRQYNIGYYPEKEGQAGQRKQIKVRIYRPDLIVRARDSYIVGADRKTSATK